MRINPLCDTELYLLQIPFKKANFRYQLLWMAIGWVIIGLILYLTLMPYPFKVLEFSYADKLEHLFAYSMLMGWFTQLYSSKKNQLFMATLFCFMGISLEFIQGWGGHRFFEYADMVANTAGVFLGWWLSRHWCAGWLYRIDSALSRK